MYLVRNYIKIKPRLTFLSMRQSVIKENAIESVNLPYAKRQTQSLSLAD